MPDSPEHLAERLKTEGEKSAAFFRDLTPDEMERGIYTDGCQWTVRQVLAHFVFTEDGITRLMRSVMGGAEGVPADFDIERYNAHKTEAYLDLPAKVLLSRFLELRNETAAFALSLRPDDLQKTGRHPFLGVVPIEEMIKLLYRHNQLHQRDIKRVLAAK